MFIISDKLKEGKRRIRPRQPRRLFTETSGRTHLGRDDGANGVEAQNNELREVMKGT